MRRAHVLLSLALIIVWLGSGTGPTALPLAAGDSVERAAEAGPVPSGLGPSEWERIQAQVAKLTAADGAAGDYFGHAVSVSGDTAVVGAHYAAVGSISQGTAYIYQNGGGPEAWAEGTAYIFYRNRGGPDAWGQVAKLIAADGHGDPWQFGFSVAVSGNTAVVGAFKADIGGNVSQGAAYVFYRDHGGADAWGQVAKLTAGDGAAYDFFGMSVSVSGDAAIVGAPRAHVSGSKDQGAAYVFYRNSGGANAWGQVAKLLADDGAAWDYFGESVSVNGNTAVVGAVIADVGGNANQGAAYVFYRDQGGPDAWGQVTKLVADDGAEGDYFGASVWVSGDTAVLGAKQADIGGNDRQGAAYIFYRDQGGADAWGQVAKLIAADGAADDHFGASVSVNGDTAVVGAVIADVSGNADQGAAYVFYRNQGGPDAWGQVAKLTAADGAADDVFGLSVSVSGDTAVVGACRAEVGGNADQGAAYVYAWPPVAADDAYATPEDTPLLVPAARGVLANDTAPYGFPLTAVLDTGPAYGTLDLLTDGSLTYTPTIDYAGLDTFTYHANDGAADSNVATVRILVYTHVIYLPVVLRNG